MSIEEISLEHFSAQTQTETATTPQAHTRHAVFHSFLFDEIKQDAATNISHRTQIIKLLKQHNILPDMLITIWEYTYGCAENYICALHYN